MPTTPLPASIRKRSEQYAKNIHNRGHVKKSLNPKVEQRLEAERQQKQGLKTGQPVLGPSGRRVVVVLLLITLGSALYQILQPLLASLGRSAAPAPETSPNLSREQQARAAEAVLRELNRKATEKYLRTAKDYQPPAAPKEDNAGNDADGDDADDDGVWDEPARPAMEPLV
ncbi:hypothetical protein LPJ61_003203 [Coemansia biformis]|uniref:Uncharacterized protein n=1 Tax=Coemansia biformis TaxID=1286918 RepID=A0A9W7YBV1_9FUNG|nr:hypothetical protein LPJ61_003203 [Coemansia biformis]